MADIESLFGAYFKTEEPCDALVYHLEDLLDRAKSGNICGIAYARQQPDGSATFCVVGYTDSFSIIGALESAKALLVRDHIEE